MILPANNIGLETQEEFALGLCAVETELLARVLSAQRDYWRDPGENYFMTCCWRS